MATKNQNESPMSLVCMESETFSHQGELVWSIKNFTSKLESLVSSLEFSLVPSCKIRLQIRLLLQNPKRNTTIVYVDRKDNKGPSFISAEIQCSIQNPTGDSFQLPNNINKDHTLYTNNGQTNYHQVQLNSLLPWDLTKYSCTDALVLRCQIKLKSCCDAAQFVNTKEYKTSLGFQIPTDMILSLQRLHSEKPFTDCQIRVGDATLPAHKGILSVRSPVFQSMFEHDMLEKKTNEIVIPDFDPKVVSALLTYLYTNTIEDLTIEEIRQLFAIADKYQVDSLMDKCTTLLLRNLDEKTVCKTLQLADMHNNDVMKEIAAHYISENFSTLRSNPEFIRLMDDDPRLVLHIILAKQMQPPTNEPEDRQEHPMPLSPFTQTLPEAGHPQTGYIPPHLRNQRQHGQADPALANPNPWNMNQYGQPAEQKRSPDWHNPQVQDWERKNQYKPRGHLECSPAVRLELGELVGDALRSSFCMTFSEIKTLVLESHLGSLAGRSDFEKVLDEALAEYGAQKLKNKWPQNTVPESLYAFAKFGNKLDRYRAVFLEMFSTTARARTPLFVKKVEDELREIILEGDCRQIFEEYCVYKSGFYFLKGTISPDNLL